MGQGQKIKTGVNLHSLETLEVAYDKAFKIPYDS